jgi:hypothetical protein
MSATDGHVSGRVISGLNTHGIAFSTERQAGVDRRTTFGLRFDGERSLYQLQPLFHADEAKPSTHLRLSVKTDAAVTHTELNLIRRSPQAHFEVLYPTVFHRIVEGFLQNSEEAQRNVRRH